MRPVSRAPRLGCRASLLARAHALGVEAQEAALLCGVRRCLSYIEQPCADGRGVLGRGLSDTMRLTSVYALGDPSGLKAGATPDEVTAALREGVLASGTISALYAR